MLAFYLSMFRDIPSVLRTKREAWIFWLWTLIVPLVVWFNPQLTRAMDTPEFSRWFVMVPIGASVFYGLLRANYVRVRGLQKQVKEAHDFEKTRLGHSVIRTALGNFQNDFVTIQNRCVEGKESVDDVKKELERLVSASYEFVHQFFDGGEAALLNQTTFPALDPNARAIVATNAELRMMYMVAQFKAEALGKLIDRTRP